MDDEINRMVTIKWMHHSNINDIIELNCTVLSYIVYTQVQGVPNAKESQFQCYLKRTRSIQVKQ